MLHYIVAGLALVVFMGILAWRLWNLLKRNKSLEEELRLTSAWGVPEPVAPPVVSFRTLPDEVPREPSPTPDVSKPVVAEPVQPVVVPEVNVDVADEPEITPILKPPAVIVEDEMVEEDDPNGFPPLLTETEPETSSTEVFLIMASEPLVDDVESLSNDESVPEFINKIEEVVEEPEQKPKKRPGRPSKASARKTLKTTK